MDNDQLEKRVEWLDKERLDEKSNISEMKKRVDKLEGALEESTKYISDLTSEITRLNVIIEKVDKFEKTLTNYSADVKKQLDAHETRQKGREREARKMQSLELDEINRTLTEYRDGLDTIESTKIELNARKTEEERLAKTIADVKASVQLLTKSEEDRKRTAGSSPESRQQDLKRMADLQGEFSAVRKRLDEFGGKMELVLADQRKTDVRINEIQAAEEERRASQIEFTEQVTKTQDERARKWKEWSKRFESIEKQSEQLAGHLKNISDTELAVQKAKDAFNEITDQLGRRINEITEMQRIGEERFRQEFATFKADDQKRWTNHMLTQEELQRESTRRLERLSGQTTNLEDTVQEMQDIVQHLSDQTEKRLQTMLANMSEWVAESERFLGSMR